MVYGVNNLELGINDILQLIELTLGEGKIILPKFKNNKLIVLCAEGAQNFILCAITNLDHQIKISFSEGNE